MIPTIKTIEDMEKLYYSKVGSNYISKVDAPVLSSTTGVYNAVYGAMVWGQINQEANVFGCMPKFPWLRSGWRVITARAASSSVGVAEGGSLPDTVKPTFAELTASPKSIAHNFEVAEVQDFLAAESLDDAFGGMDHMRPLIGMHHKEMINVMLLRDVSAEAGAATGHRDATYDDQYESFETIDRIVASNSEETAFGGTYDNWFDPYGTTVNREAVTYDAQVSHASGTDRTLTDSLIRTQIATVKEYGANPSVVITGHDTYSRIQGLYDTAVRYSPLGMSKASFGVNGINTATGLEMGIDVATVYGLPLIVSKNVTKDTISRIYILDTSDPEGFGEPRLGIKIAKPTQYFEAGIGAGTPFSVGKLSTEGMYRTMGEIVCHNFVTQGKIRDLK